MKAIQTEPPGGLDHTQLVDIPEPTATADEVLVEIHAASLNPADRFQIDGSYPGGPKPPFIAGRDAAGVVIQTEELEKLPFGARVLVLQSAANDLAHGTFCERQRFRPERLVTIPDGWSFAEAAAAPLVFQTAWQALREHGDVTPQSAVLVTGAGGGVGIAAVQLAVGLGATVIALSRSAEKQRRLRQLGAQHVFSPDAPDLKQLVFSALGRKGVDVAVDAVGGRLLTQAIHLLGPNGRVSALGVLDDVEATIPIPSLMFKRASLHGVLVSGCTHEEAVEQWNAIVDVLARSGQRPIVDQVFALADFRSAFDRLQGSPFGKVILEMRSTGS